MKKVIYRGEAEIKFSLTIFLLLLPVALYGSYIVFGRPEEAWVLLALFFLPIVCIVGFLSVAITEIVLRASRLFGLLDWCYGDDYFYEYLYRDSSRHWYRELNSFTRAGDPKCHVPMSVQKWWFCSRDAGQKKPSDS